MDEIVDQLKTSFNGLYKCKGSRDGQEQRRKELLDTQKSNRLSLTDKYRDILGIVEAAEDQSQIYHKQRGTYKPKIYVSGYNRCPYNNVLMLSEWMIEKPDDFHENWYVLPCPKAVRVLVVSGHGSTKFYSKYGQFITECATALPGGSPHQSTRSTRCCVLDGFYIESTHTIYLLDLLAWNSHLMADGETEFRHYWMLIHLHELPELANRTKQNNIIFKILPKVPCDPENFSEFMMRIPHFPDYNPKLDGLLFYHKRSHYVAGETPLVGWILPFMVPEVFGEDVKVNPAYVLEKPLDYVNQADFIEKFTKKLNKKKIRRQSDAMDTTPPLLCPAPAATSPGNKCTNMETLSVFSKPDETLEMIVKQKWAEGNMEKME